jgi:DNA-binding beta-propeller fold protein YncE
MTAQIETVFQAPGVQPNGLQATHEGLWILDQIDPNHVYLVSYAGQVLRSFVTESIHGSGITDDGKNLWVASTFGRTILKIDRNTGATIQTYASPDASERAGGHGLEWRNGRLWFSNPPSATVYELDVSGPELTVVKKFPAPGNRPHGLAFHDGLLWCVETNHRAIYGMDPEDGRHVRKIEVPEPYPEPHGMTFWDGHFWYCDALTAAVCTMPYTPE